MTRKKYYMILDTETASTASIPFDIAYTIIDREGNIITQKNYLVADVFNSPMGQHLLMHDDFSKNKMQTYIKFMQEGLTTTPFAIIREEMREVVKKYNCIVVAYNAKFDYECLTNFAHSLGFKNFFKNSTQIWDLWNIALTIIGNSNAYVKFCKSNKLFTASGSIKTSAEVMYRFIIKDNNFVESHTALDDTEIEAQIMITCLKRHKKMQTDFITNICSHPVWRSRCKKAKVS